MVLSPQEETPFPEPRSCLPVLGPHPLCNLEPADGLCDLPVLHVSYRSNQHHVACGDRPLLRRGVASRLSHV